MTDPPLPRLRSATLATAIATIAYLAFWVWTTQVPDVRAVVPFGEDPYDVFASVAIVLLPLVGGLTAIRVIRYGLAGIPAGPVADRIVLGLAVCLALVSAALVATAVSVLADQIETTDGTGAVVMAAIAITSAVTALAWVALVRAWDAMPTSDSSGSIAMEPDALDDIVAVLPRDGPARAEVAAATELLRRHRSAAGFGAALMAGIAAVAWHAIREGAWASPAAALVYGGMVVAILLVAYLLLVGPLRVLRAA
jgi:hypothetical protein